MTDDLERGVEADAPSPRACAPPSRRRPRRRAACRRRRGRARPSAGRARRRVRRPRRSRSGARLRGRAKSGACVRPASTRAAASGSRGSPSARGSTLVPPPGTKPTTVSGRTPFSASLKPPSPEKTTTASVSASRASSVACPARSVKTVSDRAESARDLLGEVGRHPAGVGIDDQRRPHRAIVARSPVPASRGVPELEPAARRVQIRSELAVERRNLVAKLEELEGRPPLLVAGVALARVPCDRFAAFRARHVPGLWERVRHRRERNRRSLIGNRARKQERSRHTTSPDSSLRPWRATARRPAVATSRACPSSSSSRRYGRP